MRFVFDENHPPVLADVVRTLFADDPHEVTTVFALGLRGTPDEDLVRLISAGTNQTVLVTTDRRMRRRKHEEAAIRSTGVIVVVGAKGWEQASAVDRGRMMLWWWPTIIASAAVAKPATFLMLPFGPGIRPLKRWN